MAKRAFRGPSTTETVVLSRAKDLANRAGSQIIRSAQNDAALIHRAGYSFPSNPF